MLLRSLTSGTALVSPGKLYLGSIDAARLTRRTAQRTVVGCGAVNYETIKSDERPRPHRPKCPRRARSNPPLPLSYSVGRGGWYSRCLVAVCRTTLPLSAARKARAESDLSLDR